MTTTGAGEGERWHLTPVVWEHLGICTCTDGKHYSHNWQESSTLLAAREADQQTIADLRREDEEWRKVVNEQENTIIAQAQAIADLRGQLRQAEQKLEWTHKEIDDIRQLLEVPVGVSALEAVDVTKFMADRVKEQDKAIADLKAELKQAAETYLVALDVSEQTWRKEVGQLEQTIAELRKALEVAREMQDTMTTIVGGLREGWWGEGSGELEEGELQTAEDELDRLALALAAIAATEEKA
jgi:chromosome segregation ATPase